MMAVVAPHPPMGEVVSLILGAGTVSLGSAVVLLRFADKSVGWSSFFAAVLGFTLSFSIVGLIPIDVWASLAQAETRNRVGAPSHLLVRESWTAIYWTTTVLCYLVIPFLLEFETAGEFSFAARLRKSLRNNLVWYLVYLVIAISGVIWTLAHGMDLHSLGAWCIAASNAWGLILLTMLMGFGLVALPRQLWKSGNPSGQLRVLYPVATARDEARKSAQYELQEIIVQALGEVEMRDVALVEEDVGLKRAYSELQQTLSRAQDLQRTLSGERNPSEQSSGGTSDSEVGIVGPKPRVMGLQSVPSANGANGGSGDPTKIMSRLVKLHVELKTAILEARRAACRFEQLVSQCLQYEDLEAEEGRLHAVVESFADMPDNGCCDRLRRTLCRGHAVHACCRRLHSVWVRRWRARAFHFTSYACGLLSALIVLGQLTMLDTRFNLSVLSMFFLSDHGAVLTQALCAVPLSYMACTAYWSVFRTKIGGWYGLYSDHNTDAGSLLWCSYSLARLALPLCYHFLLLIDAPPHLRTSFQEFMGQMVLVPILGYQMNRVFPCLVALVVLCNVTQVYSRIVSCLGLAALEFDWSPSLENEDPLAEGKELIERERRRRVEEAALELQRRSETDGMAGAVPLRSLSFGLSWVSWRSSH